MQTYCDNCYVTFDGARCPVCGKKCGRGPEPSDPVFLTEKEQIWSDMLADVLKQHDIPFMGKNVLGAGLALKTGPLRERVRFYVPYEKLSEAADIVEELFSSPVEEDENEEDDEL